MTWPDLKQCYDIIWALLAGIQRHLLSFFLAKFHQFEILDANQHDFKVILKFKWDQFIGEDHLFYCLRWILHVYNVLISIKDDCVYTSLLQAWEGQDCED